VSPPGPGLTPPGQNQELRRIFAKTPRDVAGSHAVHEGLRRRAQVKRRAKAKSKKKAGRKKARKSAMKGRAKMKGAARKKPAKKAAR